MAALAKAGRCKLFRGHAAVPQAVFAADVLRVCARAFSAPAGAVCGEVSATWTLPRDPISERLRALVAASCRRHGVARAHDRCAADARCGRGEEGRPHRQPRAWRRRACCHRKVRRSGTRGAVSGGDARSDNTLAARRVALSCSPAAFAFCVVFAFDRSHLRSAFAMAPLYTAVCSAVEGALRSSETLGNEHCGGELFHRLPTSVPSSPSSVRTKRSARAKSA